MPQEPKLEHFTEHCLKTVGLGPIFRLVVQHETNFDSIAFTTHMLKPMAESLDFVCKVVDLSRLGSTDEATNELDEIEGLLCLCGDELRPLLVVQNTDHLLDRHLATFHTKLRTLLDCYETTAVIFLSSQKQSIGTLFKDSSMPFYCSASLIDLTD